MAEGPVRVLLVEDDDDDFLLTQELFAELPPGAYHLDRASHYEGALATLENCEHDLYLVDYRLGNRTGLELLQEALRQGCKAPMIMLTGQRDRELDLQAMQAGAADYLVKDRLDASALERSMRYALQQKRHAEAIRQVNQRLEERVRERTAELAELNEALRAEVAERRRVEEALRETDRRKDTFLATLAHELRNPLAPLTSATQLIQLVPDDKNQVRRLAGMMSRQLQQLVRLIEDLLDVSRISRGKLTLRRERVALREVIDLALDVSRPSIEAAAHALEMELPDEPLALDGDRVRLAQILSNLLINAAKYTPRGGRIQLKVHRDDDHVALEVRDNGIGIPPVALAKIFELFMQADGSMTRSHGGLGIGLTIVKTLVEMHGGSVKAESQGPGRGSVFMVRLPLAVSAPGAENASVETSAAAPSALRTFRVLIVDDNEPAAYLLRRLLEKLDQQVRTASSATAALEFAPHFAPEVIISDIAMPGLSGYDLARQIRAMADLPQPTLIALTGYGQESDRQQSYDAGFDYHLTKPVGLPALERLLSSLPILQGDRNIAPT
jgi:signal transduction histidine kinase